MKELVNTIISEGLTKVSIERFDMITRHANQIKQLDGDIIECGVWKGGMGIYLSKLFSEKKVWLADSFQGFEDPRLSQYFYANERHLRGGMSVAHSAVMESLKRYECNNVDVLLGFVNETLPAAAIEKISLLRIDVDAYSATREVLDHLYSKVVSGGYIVFDDTCLVETRSAILDFFKLHELQLQLRNPVNDEHVVFTHASQQLPCGCYLIKE